MTAAQRDPRYVYSLVMRQIALQNGRNGRWGIPIPRIPAQRPKHKMKIDWAVSLENGYVPQNQFPAKYQFGIGTRKLQYRLCIAWPDSHFWNAGESGVD